MRLPPPTNQGLAGAKKTAYTSRPASTHATPARKKASRHGFGSDAPRLRNAPSLWLSCRRSEPANNDKAGVFGGRRRAGVRSPPSLWVGSGGRRPGTKRKGFFLGGPPLGVGLRKPTLCRSLP